MTTTAILYHDGCNICLDVAATFSASMPGLEVVNLTVESSRNDEAMAAGVMDLPCLLLNGKVFPLNPHSVVGGH